MARQNNTQHLGPMNGFREIAMAATISEELELTRILESMADRIRRLPGSPNTDTPRHRVRGICYRLWSDTTSIREIHEYIQTNLRRIRE